MFVQQAAYLIKVGAFLSRYQTLPWRHDVCDTDSGALLKTHISTGYDANQFRSVDHRHPGDPMISGQIEQLFH